MYPYVFVVDPDKYHILYDIACAHGLSKTEPGKGGEEGHK